jgi:hypothetical protein
VPLIVGFVGGNLVAEGTLACRPFIARVVGPDLTYGVKRRWLGVTLENVGKRWSAVPLRDLWPLDVLDIRAGTTADEDPKQVFRAYAVYRREVSFAKDVQTVDQLHAKGLAYVLMAIAKGAWDDPVERATHDGELGPWLQPMFCLPGRKPGAPQDGTTPEAVVLPGVVMPWPTPDQPNWRSPLVNRVEGLGQLIPPRVGRRRIDLED